MTTRKSPTSLRLTDEVENLLRAHLTTHPGDRQAPLLNRLVAEGLLTRRHPGIVFRDGPSGRRAAVEGGPDVCEVIRSVRQARAAEPDADERTIIDVVRLNSGLTNRAVEIAVEYWAEHTAEIDAEVAAADQAEADALAAWQKSRQLLGR